VGVPPLRADDLPDDPLAAFRAWFREAQEGVAVPEATAVATATADGRPSVRMVLLKAADERGLTFFSGYGSRKGRELAANPHAALLFHWEPLGRQVRAEGAVEQVARDETEAYFASRPRASRLAAWASHQSAELGGRSELEAAYAAAERRFADAGDEIPAPPWWGGYRLVPDAWEFWQHGADRLHDRFRYEHDGAGGWRRTRLAP
jgi:pyridoxamine 5'-phosphate oxidase